LRDPEATRVSWVSLPDPMSVDETASAATSLAEAKIPLTDVIVNRVTPAPAVPCRWCDGRRVLEYHAMARLRSRLPRVSTIEVAARVPEPRGLPTLRKIGRDIADANPLQTGRTTPSRASRPYVADTHVTRAPISGG